MTANPRAGRIALQMFLAGGLGLLLSACVSDSGPPVMSLQAAEAAPARSAAPVSATYDCGDDGRITVEAMQSAVHLVDAEGASYDLPASPPTQASRYGEGNVALVVEGGEALWMKAGREPMTCRR